LKQKPRVVEEHDRFFGIISAVEAGTGIAIGADTLGQKLVANCCCISAVVICSKLPSRL
jgi:hypothetical protein